MMMMMMMMIITTTTTTGVVVIIRFKSEEKIRNISLAAMQAKAMQRARRPAGRRAHFWRASRLGYMSARSQWSTPLALSLAKKSDARPNLHSNWPVFCWQANWLCASASLRRAPLQLLLALPPPPLQVEVRALHTDLGALHSGRPESAALLLAGRLVPSAS